MDLIILAPQYYYRMYGLIDCTEDRMSIVKKALTDLSSAFNTNISLMELPLDKENFYDICRRVSDDKKKTTGQEIISISSADSIRELARGQWKLLVAADRKP